MIVINLIGLTCFGLGISWYYTPIKKGSENKKILRNLWIYIHIVLGAYLAVGIHYVPVH